MKNKKCVIFIAVFLCLIFTACDFKLIGSATKTDAPEKENPTLGFSMIDMYYVTNKDGVNIYRTPEIDGEIYMTLNKGVELRGNGQKDGWVRVRLNDIACYVMLTDIDETTIKWATETDAKRETHVIFIDPAKQINKDESLEPIRPDLSLSDIASSEKEENAKTNELAKASMAEAAVGVTTGNFEYEITYKIADKVRNELTTLGYTVILSRETNSVNLSNSRRALDAIEQDAEMYVRISAGAAKDSDLNGMATFITTDKNPNTVKYYTSNYEIADLILNKASKATGAKKRGIYKTDRLTSLNYCTAMPAVSINIGYLSNETDDTNLSNEDYQNKLAEAIAEGIDEYFKGKK